jgi:adenylate kinase
VATGDLFRENLSNGTELGMKAKVFMEVGKLVPDELVLDMLFDRLEGTDAAAGYLLDGFPRTLPQAKALDARLAEKAAASGASASISHVLIDVDDGVLVERATGRRICKNCGNIHNIKYSPPKSEGVCDVCGGELYQRADDTAETVGERLAVYRRDTQPVIDYYEAQHSLMRVDGRAAPDQVFESLKQCLREAA